MLGRHIGAWGHLKWPATGKQGHFKSQLPWAEALDIFLSLIWTFLGERPCGLPWLSGVGSLPSRVSRGRPDCCSLAQLCPTFCDPVDCSTPGSSVLHCPLEFSQIHVC